MQRPTQALQVFKQSRAFIDGSQAPAVEITRRSEAYRFVAAALRRFDL